jgi:sec-independent protein translocase protein TatA
MVPLLALPEGGEWIVLLVIVLLLFGSKKLPELTRNSARALVEFRKVASGKDDDSKPETAEGQPQAEVRQPQAEVGQPQAEVGQPQAEVSAERPPRTTADNPPQT